MHQAAKCDFTADLTGTGNWSVEVTGHIHFRSPCGYMGGGCCIDIVVHVE